MLDDLEDQKNILKWTRGNETAAMFVMQFFFVCHLWDDLIDQDVEREPEHINQAFWLLFVDIQKNAFYQAYISELLPVIETAILDWHGANVLERESDHGRDIAYTLRVSILSVITKVAQLCGGYEHAKNMVPDIRRYGQRETLAEYIEDLKNA